MQLGRQQPEFLNGTLISITLGNRVECLNHSKLLNVP